MWSSLIVIPYSDSLEFCFLLFPFCTFRSCILSSQFQIFPSFMYFFKYYPHGIVLNPFTICICGRFCFISHYSFGCSFSLQIYISSSFKFNLIFIVYYLFTEFFSSFTCTCAITLHSSKFFSPISGFVLLSVLIFNPVNKI